MAAFLFLGFLTFASDSIFSRKLFVYNDPVRPQTWQTQQNLTKDQSATTIKGRIRQTNRHQNRKNGDYYFRKNKPVHRTDMASSAKHADRDALSNPQRVSKFRARQTQRNGGKPSSNNDYIPPLSNSTSWKKKPPHVKDSHVWNLMVEYFPEVKRIDRIR